MLLPADNKIKASAEMTRWEALVKFDDEIRAAALTLLPYGDVWVDKLGEAFFALNEDRKYLKNIVERLELEAFVAAHEAEKENAARWLKEIRRFPDGTLINEDRSLF